MENKNPSAVALGSLGGKASAKKLTKEQRKERAKKAIQARWSKRKKMYTINKLGVGKYTFYQVVDSKGEVVKEFDAYNYQKPFMQAKNYIKELETKTA